MITNSKTGAILTGIVQATNLEKKYDKNGKISSKGKSINDYINSVFLNDAYFKKKYPKSLDRNYFNKYLIDLYDPFFFPNKEIFSKTYDFITCTETAEHFFNPKKEFDLINTLLKKDG